MKKQTKPFETGAFYKEKGAKIFLKIIEVTPRDFQDPFSLPSVKALIFNLKIIDEKEKIYMRITEGFVEMPACLYKKISPKKFKKSVRKAFRKNGKILQSLLN